MGTAEARQEPQLRPTCSVADCDLPIRSGGLCNKHKLRADRLGSTDDSALRTLGHLDPQDRLLARIVETESGCWVWTGAANESGYGVMQLHGATHRAHRLSYEWFVGPVPEGLVLDHLCRVRLCINPEHLEPVTAQENSLRGQAAREQCRNGHDYDEANTVWRLVRSCRSCTAESKKQSRARR